MINKKVVAAVCGGVLVAGGIISWLLFGGEVSTNVDLGNDIKGKINASLKDSFIQREKNGVKLWEFKVGEVINDKFTGTASLKGISGKLYRDDGSYLEIHADQGTMELDSNNFFLEGNVRAVVSDGTGLLTMDKIYWEQKTHKIVAEGNVKLRKDEWSGSADKIITTSELKTVAMQGRAMVEKGGE